MSQLVGLFKRGLDEVPHLMFSGFLLCTGTVFLGLSLHRYKKYELDRLQWKKRYTVYREGDPRLERQVHPASYRAPVF